MNKRKMVVIVLLVFATSLLMPSSASSNFSSSTSMASGTVAVVASSISLAVSPGSSQAYSSVSLVVSPSSNQATLSVSLAASSSSNQTPTSPLSPTTTAQAGTLPSTDISPTSPSLGQSASASMGVNPCGKNNGGCAHYCTVTHGSKYCTCATGFKLESDLHSCTDINECNSTTVDHNCAQICVNTLGSYACACRSGHKLDMDGLACKEVPTTAPTSKSPEQQWDWIVLGIVIGSVVFAILTLVAGVISKMVLRNKRKETIAGINDREMTAVKGTSAMAATNPVAIES